MESLSTPNIGNENVLVEDVIWQPYPHEVIEISSDEEDNGKDGGPQHSNRHTLPDTADPAPPNRTTDADFVVDSAIARYNGTYLSPQKRKRPFEPDMLQPMHSPSYFQTGDESLIFADVELYQDQQDFLWGPRSDLANGGIVNNNTIDLTRYESETIAQDPPQKHEMHAPRLRPDFTRSKAFSKRPRQAPYYDDAKLGVRMYRGPGFERFPVPLESLHHRMMCDLWDKRQAHRSKRQRMSSNVTSTHNPGSAQTVLQRDESVDDIDMQYEIGSADLECLGQVLEVLPDVEHHFVLDIIELMTEGLKGGIEQVPSSNNVLAKIMEFKDYPKEKADPFETNDTGDTISVTREIVNQPNYHRDATILLAEEFDFIPTYHIQRLVSEKKSLYDAFLSLSQSEAAYQSSVDAQRPYKRLRQPRLALEKKYARKPNSLRDNDQWLKLINELQAAKQHVARKDIKEEEQKQKEATEDANLKAHIASGDVIECQCCFDDEVPSNRSVKCSAGIPHLYCFNCIERLAGSNTGGGKYAMLCMSQCGCKAQLDPDGISKAVPTSILRKLAFNQQQAEIDAAGIQGLEKCPHCDFKGICDPIEIDPVFSCLDPECGKVTCRLCFEPAHSPKTCEQVKKEKGLLERRHLIEEARSEAMMRTCPRCKKKAIKESGCNKVTCTCGCMSCFVCQKDISKEMYRHFGAAPKCPQSDNFDRHEFDANQAEKAAIDKIRLQDPGLEEKDLAFDGLAARDKRIRKVDQLQQNVAFTGFDRVYPVVDLPLLAMGTGQILDHTNRPGFEEARTQRLGMLNMYNQHVRLLEIEQGRRRRRRSRMQEHITELAYDNLLRPEPFVQPQALQPSTAIVPHSRTITGPDIAAGIRAPIANAQQPTMGGIGFNFTPPQQNPADFALYGPSTPWTATGLGYNYYPNATGYDWNLGNNF